MNNKVIENLRFSEGILEFGGIPYLLIRPDTIVEFQKAVEKELGSDKCGQLMAEGGRLGGSRSSGKYRMQGRSGGELVRYMCEVGTDLGWGTFRLLHLDVQHNSFVVEVRNSAFAMAYGKSERPVCHLIRGVMEGLGGSVFQQKATCIETECLAKGDEICRFEVAADKEVGRDERR